MPLIKSAVKRVRVANRKRKQNLLVMNKYKSLVKEFLTLVEDGKTAEAVKMFPQVQKSIDLAAKKNLMHNNTAARKKSSLSKRINDKQGK